MTTLTEVKPAKKTFFGNVLGLFAVVFLFSLAAFSRIDKQGLLYFDAGMNLLEAKFVQESVQILTSRPLNELKQSGFWTQIKSETSGIPPVLAKPGFTVILAIGGMIQGFSDNLSAKISVLAAILNLYLTFLLASALFNRTVAWYSLLILASSAFYFLLARSGLADQVTMTFFLSALLTYVHSQKFLHKKFLAYAVGFLFGYAFACNQWRVSYLFAMILLVDTFSFWAEKRPVTVWISQGLLKAAGFVTPLILFQAPYWLARLFVGELPFPDYWAQLVERYQQLKSLVWFQNVDEMFRMWWAIESPLFVVFFICAGFFILVRVVKERNPKLFLLLVYTLVPFIYFSMMKYGGEVLPRTISSILPAGAIAIGALLFSLEALFSPSRFLSKYGRIFVMMALAGLFLSALFRNERRLITSSGYPAASAFLQETGEKQFMIYGQEPVWRFYLGKVAYSPYATPVSWEDLFQQTRAENIKYLILDYSTIHFKYGTAFTNSVLGKVKPAAEFDNPRAASLPYLLDEYGFEKAKEIAQDPWSRKIYIFNIEEIASVFQK